MANVGYLEELLFRGYLLEAIEQDKGRRRAVIISGITFGLGHIVNIFRGYQALELVAQIAGAIAIGLVLALLVVETGTSSRHSVSHSLQYRWNHNRTAQQQRSASAAVYHRHFRTLSTRSSQAPSHKSIKRIHHPLGVSCMQQVVAHRRQRLVQKTGIQVLDCRVLMGLSNRLVAVLLIN